MSHTSSYRGIKIAINDSSPQVHSCENTHINSPHHSRLNELRHHHLELKCTVMFEWNNACVEATALILNPLPIKSLMNLHLSFFVKLNKLWAHQSL